MNILKNITKGSIAARSVRRNLVKGELVCSSQYSRDYLGGPTPGQTLNPRRQDLSDHYQQRHQKLAVYDELYPIPRAEPSRAKPGYRSMMSGASSDGGSLDYVPMRSSLAAKKPYPCPEMGCPKSFDRKVDAQRHFRRLHGPAIFECDVCKKGFQSR